MSLPDFQSANLISRVSILTNTFELLNVPKTHVQLINRIPTKQYTDIVGMYFYFDKTSVALEFLNDNQHILYGIFNSCEITENTILCYGVKNND